MKSPPLAPRIREYAGMLRDSWVVIVLATALSATAGWAVYATRSPVYTADATLFATVPGGAGVRSVLSGGRDALSRVETYANVSTSAQVLTRAAADLGRTGVDGAPTPEDLAARVTASFEPSSVLLKITATARSADAARDVANAVARNTIEVARESEWNYEGAAGATGALLLVDGAVTARGSRGELSRYLTLGAGLGVVLSSLLVLARGTWRSAVLSRGQLDHVMCEVVGRKPT